MSGQKIILNDPFVYWMGVDGLMAFDGANSHPVYIANDELVQDVIPVPQGNRHERRKQEKMNRGKK